MLKQKKLLFKNRKNLIYEIKSELNKILLILNKKKEVINLREQRRLLDNISKSYEKK